MIPCEALSRQNYGGVWYKTGDTIDVNTEQEVVDMENLRPPVVRRLPAASTYATRTMEEPVTSTKTATVQASPQKGKYDRRDLRAR